MLTQQLPQLLLGPHAGGLGCKLPGGREGLVAAEGLSQR